MMMAKKVQHIPVRRSGKGERTSAGGRDGSSDRADSGVTGETAPLEAQSLPEPDVTASAEASGEAVDWRDMALRLRAEMDNYRKRQQRLAEEQIAAERKRLLAVFLAVPDNLERIVTHLQPDDPHHRSIQVAYDEFLRLLRLEGVEAIAAVGKPFDPLRHDAVAMVPAEEGQREEMLVIDEEQKGYRLGEQILRPARVVVAKR